MSSRSSCRESGVRTRLSSYQPSRHCRTVPPMIRAVVCRELGSLDNVVVDTLESPIAQPREVLVEVKAAGVNYVDGLMCQGRYQIKFATPYVPGGELAGVVLAVGDGSEGFAPGDRVMALSGFGAFCEQMVLPVASLVKMPDRLGFGQGATMIQSYATAMYAFKRAGLAAGEKVLVLGAGGGIGLASVDVAVAFGAEVIAAASTADKLSAAQAAGATSTILYEDEDLKQRVRDLSGGGVDIVIDPVGGDKSEAALRALGKFGRLCVIGFTSGTIPSVPLNQVLLSNRSVIGIDWGAWTGSDPIGNRKLIEEAVEMAGQGSLRPGVPAERPLEDARFVMAELLERRVVGKVVLVP
jgi:NADPH2:quinone reductase